ncbi:MAG: AAA family ATPase [Aliivibrio sp.]|nr:AAA family ATPase [Aliivibrio sp.]
MAIQFARMRILTRSSGHCAVRSACYNARSTARSEMTGDKYSFADRHDLEHHEILLPKGAPEEMKDFEVFWNKAQLAEKRINSQEAKELLLALPANPEITDKMRLEMARGFVQDNFVSHGVGAQLDIHGPHDDGDNYHAHVLITTRRINEDGMGEKARDMNGLFAKGYVMDGEKWGEVWKDYQNDYFLAKGLDVRVDEISLIPTEHIGPERMRTEADVLAINRNSEAAKEAAEMMLDPDMILEQLTAQKSSFSVDELSRYIDRHGFDEKAANDIFKSVIYSPEILYTVDKNGELDERFTTRTVRAEEAEAMKLSRALFAESDAALAPAKMERVARSYGLSDEQATAMEAGLSGKRLTVIRGKAGTGKSFMLGAMRDGLKRGGHDVIGLAPTNMVASALREDGFDKAYTVHSFLFQDENDRIDLKEGTRLVVDEAAMLDSRTMKAFMEAAYKHRAAVVLVGDDGQLSAIERGGLFTDIAKLAGASELTEVRRQNEEWSKAATEALGSGDIKGAIKAYDSRGFIIKNDDAEASQKALIEKWKTDFDLETNASRFVFAYRNKDVDVFNMAMREHLQEQGHIDSKNHAFNTKHGRFDFSKGDQLIMTETDKRAGLINGQGGKIVDIDGAFITLEINNELRTLDVSEFTGFRHGYAGTIYKGQGRTVDHAYIYHTRHWGQANGYVALSRHKADAHLFVAGEFRDTDKLVKSLKRDDRKVSSLALELADKQSDDSSLGREFEVNANMSRVEAKIAKANHIKRVNAERDNAKSLGAEDFNPVAFDAAGFNPVGLNDTYEEAVEDMTQYRRVDPRAYVYADFRAGVAAAEINNNVSATKEATKRGLARRIAQQVISTRSTIRSLTSSSRFLIKAAKVLGRGM